MVDLYPSVSPRSCHCTQWVGGASSMTENKHRLSQMADISYQSDKSLSRLPAPQHVFVCVCVSLSASLFVSLAWAVWQTTMAVSHEQLCLTFLPSRLAQPAHQI